MEDYSSRVYDKAKYHHETVLDEGLPERHAYNHIVPFFRWLIENDLTSDFFNSESVQELTEYRAGELSIHELFESWDTCLVGDMLSETGNEFAAYYFDYDNGDYLNDYVGTLQGDLPSEFHIPYSEENYRKIAALVDRRFSSWMMRSRKKWWQFWL